MSRKQYTGGHYADDFFLVKDPRCVAAARSSGTALLWIGPHVEDCRCAQTRCPGTRKRVLLLIERNQWKGVR